MFVHCNWKVDPQAQRVVLPVWFEYGYIIDYRYRVGDVYIYAILDSGTGRVTA